MLVFNHQPNAREVANRFRLDKKNRIRLVMEPRVTAPQCFTPSERQFYGRSICTSNRWAESLSAEAVFWPQRLSQGTLTGELETYDLSMFASNKFSTVQGERYSLRRQLIRLADIEGVRLAVAGSGWDARMTTRTRSVVRSGLKSLRCGERPKMVHGGSALGVRPRFRLGFLDNQATLYQMSRMAVVIENSGDYVSEKLIDAVRAGSVPLYVGPNLEEFGLPSGIAVECPPDASGILDAFSRITFQDLAAARRCAQEWLNSDAALAHSTEVVFRRIARIVLDQLDS